MAENEVKITVRADDKATGALRGIKGAIAGIPGPLKVAGVAAAAGLGAMGVVAVKTGLAFKDAFDDIAIATGATGESLQTLERDLLQIYRQVPAQLDVASSAIGQLNTLTGMSGEGLQKLSVNAINAARLLGEDSAALIGKAGKALNLFGLTGQDATDAIDAMFVASQATNVPMTQMLGVLESYGAPLKTMGFSMNESVALLTSMDAAGLNASQAMMAMQMATKTLAEEGVVDMKAGMLDLIDSISGAETEAEALNLAMDTFGSRGAVAIVTAARNGALEIDGLTASMDASQGAIADSAAATDDIRESFTILKHTIEAELAPSLTALIERLTELSQWLVGVGIPALKNWLKENEETFRKVQAVITTVMEVIVPIVAAALGSLAHKFETAYQIIDGVVDLFDALIRGDFKAAFEAIRQIVAAPLEFVVGEFQRVYDLIDTLTKGRLTEIRLSIESVMDAAVGFVADWGVRLWSVMSGLWKTLNTAVQDGVNAVSDTVHAVLDPIIQVVQDLLDLIAKAVRSVQQIPSVADIPVVGGAVGKVGGWLGLPGGGEAAVSPLDPMETVGGWLGFQHGGFVPPGATVPAILHGGTQGEYVVPAAQMTGGGSISINFHAPVYGMPDFEEAVVESVREAAQGGAFHGVLGAP